MADFSTDVEKQQSRVLNLAEVMRCRALYSRRTGKLLRDWAELAGPGAPTLSYLRNKGALGPARFWGLENDEDVYRGLCERFGAESRDHKFVARALELWLRGGRGPRDVGVVNWDTFHLGDGGVFERNLDVVWKFALEQCHRIGNFVLIINVGLDRGRTLEDFRRALAKKDHKVTDDFLTRPGVLYRSEGRNSHRINYPVIFGFPSTGP